MFMRNLGGKPKGVVNRLQHGLCESGEYFTCAPYAVYKSLSDMFRWADVFNLMMFCFRYYVMVLEPVSVVTVSVMHPRLTEENIAMNAR